MTEWIPDNSTKVLYYVPKAGGLSKKDIGDLYETEEAVLERAAELRARHEALLASDPRYKELFDWLPDRSDFVSGVGVMVPVSVPMANLLGCIRQDYQQPIPRAKMKQIELERKARRKAATAAKREAKKKGELL